MTTVFDFDPKDAHQNAHFFSNCSLSYMKETVDDLDKLVMDACVRGDCKNVITNVIMVIDNNNNNNNNNNNSVINRFNYIKLQNIKAAISVKR